MEGNMQLVRCLGFNAFVLAMFEISRARTPSKGIAFHRIPSVALRIQGVGFRLWRSGFSIRHTIAGFGGGGQTLNPKP